MKRSLFFFVSLIIVSILFCRCKKEDPIDQTDQFVGVYFYSMTSSLFNDTLQATMSIKKKYENRVSLILEGFPAQTLYTIQDNLMIQDSYQYQYFKYFNNGVYLPFLQGGQGIIKDSKLIVKGTWFYKYAGSFDFKIVAQKVD